jgi:hypothetical protein
VILAACGATGDPALYIGNVDPRVANIVASLVDDTNKLAGANLLAVEPGRAGAFDVIVNTERLRTQNGNALGLCLHSTQEIIIPEPGVKYETDHAVLMLSATRVASTLAHEIGHAMGLDHGGSGLMAVPRSAACDGSAAQCLVEALREEGMIP